MSIRSKIQALIAAANTKTGESDTTLTDAVQTLVDGYGQGGGGISQGLEVTETDSNGCITKATWHGDVPDYAMNYFLRSASVHAVVALDDCEKIGALALSFSNAILDGSSLTSVKYIGDSAFAVAFGANNSGAGITLDLSEFTGYKNSAKNSVSVDLFRAANAYGYSGFYMPKVQQMPYRWWYTSSTPNITVQIGSIGFPLNVISGGDRPFGSATGSGTITVYTTGALLDSVKTAIQNSAGANYTFVYKAAESTTYNGTSYAAGDTMLTDGGA